MPETPWEGVSCMLDTGMPGLDMSSLKEAGKSHFRSAPLNSEEPLLILQMFASWSSVEQHHFGWWIPQNLGVKSHPLKVCELNQIQSFCAHGISTGHSRSDEWWKHGWLSLLMFSVTPGFFFLPWQAEMSAVNKGQFPFEMQGGKKSQRHQMNAQTQQKKDPWSHKTRYVALQNHGILFSLK